MAELDDTLGADLLGAIARLNRWTTARTTWDVSVAQARMLSLLAIMQPARTSDLARADSTSQPTMTAQLQRAERDGLVRRFADPDDGRASFVELTAHGQLVLAAAKGARQAALAPALAELNESERSELKAAIAVMNKLTRGGGSETATNPTPA